MLFEVTGGSFLGGRVGAVAVETLGLGDTDGVVLDEGVLVLTVLVWDVGSSLGGRAGAVVVVEAGGVRAGAVVVGVPFSEY